MYDYLANEEVQNEQKNSQSRVTFFFKRKKN